uniref:Uncharacterized protein n=1 Tax=Solanum tuberosum TaxID=4113 RepID=M1DN70_SOLTU
MHPVKCTIRRQEALGSPVSFPSLIQDEAGNERFEIKGVHRIFCDLLEKLELCLKELESQLVWLTKKEIRQCFSLKMHRERKDKNEELYKMFICRSHLLEELFEEIGHVDP